MVCLESMVLAKQQHSGEYGNNQVGENGSDYDDICIYGYAGDNDQDDSEKERWLGSPPS